MMEIKYQSEIITSAIIVVGIIVLIALIKWLFLRKIEDVRSRYIWQKTTSYLLTLLGIIALGNVWFTGVKELATIIGFASAGVAIALKDVFTNFAGWVFLIWVRPYKVSDRIQIGEYSGDVIDISLFHTSLMEIGNWVDADQSTGRVIKVPNELVFSQSFANYSRGFQYIWNEIPVLITFESNWKKAKELLLEIANKQAEHLSEKAAKKVREASQHFMIFYSKLTPTVYTSVKDWGVLLTIRYLCEPRGRRGSEEKIWEDILEAFSMCDDIDFAYPTQRFYNNIHEGKSGIVPFSDKKNGKNDTYSE